MKSLSKFILYRICNRIMYNTFRCNTSQPQGGLNPLWYKLAEIVRYLANSYMCDLTNRKTDFVNMFPYPSYAVGRQLTSNVIIRSVNLISHRLVKVTRYVTKSREYDATGRKEMFTGNWRTFPLCTWYQLVKPHERSACHISLKLAKITRYVTENRL